jgi:predicted MPP superfamily phosphohydrolase
VSKSAGRAPLKLLQLSDFHASRFVSLDFIAEAIRLGLAEKPDLICLTGDFITSHFSEFVAYGKILRPLAASAPTFACLGNHDGGSWSARAGGYADTRAVRDLLAGSGVELLHNAARTVRVADWDLTLVGLGDLWAKEIQPQLSFPTAAPVAPTVVLSHNPDSKELVRTVAWDLMLCGHTHGGQLRLPLLGTPFAPVEDMRFVEGLHRWDDRWIHITRGVGNLHGVRFNCPPEVSLLTLT